MRILIVILVVVLFLTEAYWLVGKHLELKYNVEEGGGALTFSYRTLSEVMVFFCVQAVVFVFLIVLNWRDRRRGGTSDNQI